jgi:hypothetical protein
MVKSLTWKEQNLDGLGDEAIDTTVAYNAKIASPSFAGDTSAYGGIIARAGEGETALAVETQFVAFMRS